MTVNQVRTLVSDYLLFKRSVISEGYANELDWQDRLSVNKLTEKDILKEFAWVVLSSGMNYKVINGLFPAFSNAFYQWSDAKLITESSFACKKKAMKIFANTKKLDAIIYFCETIADIGLQEIKENITNGGIGYIQTFPFMGSATAYHFAKNIGLDVVKPDRHLVRISEKLGFQTPYDLCHTISTETADKLSVVDLVFWRYATIDRAYLTKL